MSHTALPMQDLAALAVIEKMSPLVLADRLLSLAQDAARAGFPRPAERMLRLAYACWDEKPRA
jgi:hypothetical protein